MATLTFTIDGQSVTCPSGKTIIEAADAAGIYIPRMCLHLDLSPIGEVVWDDAVHQESRMIVGEKSGARAGEEAHCNLCVVEVEGSPEPVNSCVAPVADGMVVLTGTTEVTQRRKRALSKILART